MSSVAARLVREAYRREVLPARVLWWLAAEGMRDWFRVLARELAPRLPDSKATLSRLGARMFRRRWDVLRGERGLAGDDRALALTMSSLYRVTSATKSSWIFDAVGGPPRSIAEHARARLLLARLDATARWHEVATHLGELLVVLTEDLPAELPHTRKILSEVCFDAGAKYARRVKAAFGIPDTPADPPSAAMEILRISEYVFRVNPKHWQKSDGTAGWLEGTACPWYTRPGWNGAHCGIFGQFQSGIASVFGLHYHLSKTIPKHGGDTCRIDVKPIVLRRKDAIA